MYLMCMHKYLCSHLCAVCVCECVCVRVNNEAQPAPDEGGNVIAPNAASTAPVNDVTMDAELPIPVFEITASPVVVSTKPRTQQGSECSHLPVCDV